GDNPYKFITKLKFYKNSDYEQKLFKFFELEWEEYKTADKRDIDVAVADRPLFDHQIAAIVELKRKLDKSRVLLHMPTGSGKTRTVMRVVADRFLDNCDELVIWLAYSGELCEQAIEEFKEAWKYTGNSEIPIYRFFGSHNTDLIKFSKRGLIVAGLNKMHSTAKNDALFLSILADRVSLVVIDEAHQAIAKTYRFVLEQLVDKHNRKLLGLSATPGRTWSDRKEDMELSRFFQQTKITLNVGMHPVEFLIKEGFIARVNMDTIPHDGRLTDEDKAKIERSFDIPDSILDKLAKDTRRNIRIVSKLEELIDRGHKRVIVFAASINHARDISTILSARGHISFYIDSNTPKTLRDKKIAEYKGDAEKPIIICNFGVLTTGFDAPRTTAMIIARPTKSLVLYSQMVGRAIRGPKVGGSKECTVVTVTETSLPGFNNIVDAFNNWDDVW
ncbi:MAG: DEAD/DEAH box helicase, partial [Cenarchaeum sp. SB0666_bin_15]|nr:DEAD/DEAH box helicase [Cenarchaeum sp. SB0666_bin_15]